MTKSRTCRHIHCDWPPTRAQRSWRHLHQERYKFSFTGQFLRLRPTASVPTSEHYTVSASTETESFTTAVTQPQISTSGDEYYYDDDYSNDAHFTANISITTDDFLRCAKYGYLPEIYATFVVLSLSPFNFSSENEYVTQKCSMRFWLPEGNVARFQGVSCRKSFTLTARDAFHYEFGNFLRWTCGSTSAFETYSRTNVIDLYLEFIPYVEPAFHLKLHAKKAVKRPELIVHYTSPHTGYIQTPGWSEGERYPTGIDSCVTLKASPEQYIMTTFLAVDIFRSLLSTVPQDTLQMHKGQSCQGQLFWEHAFYKSVDEVRLINSSAVSIHFVSNSMQPSTGFKILFSFHDPSAVPEQLPSGKWNCSTPHWPSFRQHFLCNIWLECAGGEDEEFCISGEDSCGFGAMLEPLRSKTATICYKDLGESYVSWIGARDICAAEDMNLLQPRTKEEQIALSKLLHTRRLQWIYFGIFVSKKPMYHRMLQLASGNMAYTLESSMFVREDCPPYCISIHNLHSLAYVQSDKLHMENCQNRHFAVVLCQKIAREASTVNPTVTVQEPSVSQFPFNATLCPANHSTHTFLACDVFVDCWLNGNLECDAPLTPLPPSFTCSNRFGKVPYTLVCDHRDDCSDGSDEDFCKFQPCPRGSENICENKQCVPESGYCDGRMDCVDGSDEKYCKRKAGCVSCILPPPALINLDGSGLFNTTALSHNASCPETHFRCPGDGYCLPVYVRCNDVFDCQGHEDEAGCDDYTCPGLYRCRKSSVCLHPDHMCDGIFQCPQQDDELFCALTCPDQCVCYGLAFVCGRPFPASGYPQLRYLDASGSGMRERDVAHNSMLVHLSLASCQLRQFQPQYLPNLHSLDLSDNHLTSFTIAQLHKLQAEELRILTLARNPLTAVFPDPSHSSPVLTFGSLLHLDLSGVLMADVNVSKLGIFLELEALNLSHTQVQHLTGVGFQPLTHLHELDLRGCPLTEFPKAVFGGLHRLTTVYADNFKLCCPAVLPPGFPSFGCHAPEDSISSCEALLRSDVYRVCLVLFACLALVGNLGSFLYRTLFRRMATNKGFDVFVTHLCVSDFLMGVYLAVIGMADRLYQGSYLWEQRSWKNSTACKVAGFLSLLSSEVSALIICLITLERFLVIRFPFRSLRFSDRSAHLACAVAWLLGLSLAVVPTVPVTSHWEFYGQTGICIPLPITRSDFSGHAYSLGVMIVLNFVLFAVIAVGQMLIYWSFRANSMLAADTTRRSEDLTVARRLFTVVMSDFLCWFPVCCLGIMASSGITVSGEVNVAMAIFVLPFNSALNPFLYTLNVIMEKRREKQEALLKRRLLAELKGTAPASYTRSRTGPTEPVRTNGDC